MQANNRATQQDEKLRFLLLSLAHLLRIHTSIYLITQSGGCDALHRRGEGKIPGQAVTGVYFQPPNGHCVGWQQPSSLVVTDPLHNVRSGETHIPNHF